jgi:ppGpp synthetase/RelA/SpoT-type nucleotidyltranferase
VTKLSKSQIDKLGDRLRNSKEPAEADIRELNALLEAHQPTLMISGSVVHGVASESRIIAVRLKTARSTIEKLKRSPTMSLSRMQDLAGARIVVEGGRNTQDEVVKLLASEFSATRVVDRRVKPQIGYRAVHVIAKVEERWVESQLRTPRQHRWAEIFEKTADVCGRQIRYGHPPDPPTTSSRLQKREAFIHLLMLASNAINSIEEIERGSGSAVQRAQVEAAGREFDEMMSQMAEFVS